jgi:phosphoglycolate phosphatase-like HAD superfamily hydrolase
MGEEQPKIVAFDFDGVIGDSVYECYVQSLKAFKDLGGTVKDSKEVEKAFRKARPFVKIAEDYDAVLRMIEADKTIDFDKVSSSQFKAAQEKYKAEGAKFKDKFMAYRKDMQTKAEGEWFKLQGDFPGVVKVINGYIDKGVKMVVATTKDKASIAKLFKQYGCKIKEEDIVSRELFEDKRKQIKFISLKYDVPVNRIFFIDDMLEQVRLVEQTGAKTAMVSWGYSTEGHRKEAKESGIPVMEIEKFERDFGSFIEENKTGLVELLLLILTVIVLLKYYGII